MLHASSISYYMALFCFWTLSGVFLSRDPKLTNDISVFGSYRVPFPSRVQNHLAFSLVLDPFKWLFLPGSKIIWLFL